MKIYNIKGRWYLWIKLKKGDVLYFIVILWNIGIKYDDEIISEFFQLVKLLKISEYN